MPAIAREEYEGLLYSLVERHPEIASSTLIVFGALLALYRFVPPVTMPIRLLWPSALTAAIAFEITVYGYVVYATRFASFSTIYGPIGADLAFLLLVYLLAAIVLLGAETAAARTKREPLPRSG